MSKRYPGGVITKSPATPTGPYQTGAAPGIWTLDQQLQYQQQGVWPTAGLSPNYIEDVFSTWLYTGTGAAQTVTNDIDLSTKGGLVWVKDRSQGYSHILVDTARGISSGLSTDTTGAAGGSAGFTSFDTTGFSFGSGFGTRNNSGDNYASWTFRKQPKFFDVVTFTGDGRSSGSATISHNLGVTPAVIILKQVNGTGSWQFGTTFGSSNWLSLFLNNTNAGATTTYADNDWFAAQPTSTTFTVGWPYYGSGQQYVAYLFASNAGGFGLTGTDNVISCGSYTTDGAGVGSATLGWEPQWLLLKVSSGTGGWVLIDNMRGFVAPGGGNSANLLANTSAAESTIGIKVNATGFTDPGVLVASGTVIYIAIRRGPMKVPTDATKVFLPTARTGTGTNTTITTGFVNDSVWSSQRPGGYRGVFDRLRGANILLFQNSTGAESTYTNTLTGFDNNTGVNVGVDSGWGGINLSGTAEATYSFGRAPGFFDEVCVAGGSGVVNHNLGVVPELIISKRRDASQIWIVTIQKGSATSWWQFQGIDTGAGFNDGDLSSYATSTTFNAGVFNYNTSGGTYVDYLFASCPGVSKVGTYTGNGTTQTINCGFTGGARFVLIKRTDATGDWYVYDTARGMTTLTDPYLLLNDTAAETATLGSVTTVSTGFALNSTILAAINVNAGSYIFLAIA